MNKALYRVVFNQKRGQMMVVAENTRKDGKSGTEGTARGLADWVSILSGRLKILSFSLMLISAQVLLLSPAFASGIVTDTSAPKNQQPIILNTANGLPQVDIKTPTAAGVSVNQYQQFDVEQKGAILNNSRTNTQTQLGGWVQGNPWLAKGEARVIVNQVNSSNPSQLKGYVEVAGNRAEVVIANPAGISVNGGGFINASRSTLTTGTPIMTADYLDGYRVRGGVVSVGGEGLDTKGSDYTAILAEATKINAGIWAQDLSVVTGQNDIDAEGKLAQTVNQASRSGLAIDTSALGGMYAGKIHLVSTGRGVGVNNEGQIFASAGAVSLSADGKLTNKGAIVAQNQNGTDTVLTVKTTDMDNTGSISSQGMQSIDSNTLSNSGLIASGHTLEINNKNSIINQGEINASRLAIKANSFKNIKGRIVQTGLQDFELEAKTVSNINDGLIGGTPAAGSQGGSAPTSLGQNNATAPSTAVSGGKVVVGSAGGGINLGLGKGSIIVGNDFINDGGSITANGSVDVLAHERLDNRAQMNVNTLTLRSGDLDNQKGSLSARQLNIDVNNINNQEGTILAQNSARIQVKNSVNNQQGNINSGGVISLSAADVNNQQGSILAKGDLTLTVDNQLNNREGLLLSGSNQNISATKIDNQQGIIEAGASLKASAEVMVNAEGIVRSNQYIDLNVLKNINNDKGTISGGLGVLINADGKKDLVISNKADGKILSGNQLAINAKILDSSGVISSEGSQHLSTDSLSNTGRIVSAQDLGINNTGVLINNNGQIEATRLDIETKELDNQQGEIVQAGLAGLEIEAKEVLNTNQGIIGHEQSIEDNAATTDNDNPSTDVVIVNNDDNPSAGTGQDNNSITDTPSNNTATTNVAMTDNDTIAAPSGRILVDNSLNNAGGKIIAHGGTSLTVDNLLDNTQSYLNLTELTVKGKAVDNTQGHISADNVQIDVGDVKNINGHLYSRTGLAIKAGQAIENQQGELYAEKDIVLSAVDINNNKGFIGAKGDIGLEAKNQINNAEGQLLAQQKQDIKVKQLLNHKGLIEADKLSIVSAELNNNKGTVSSNQASHIQVIQKLDNHQGNISSQGDVVIEDDGELTINNSGQILANQDLSIKAKSFNNDGELSAGRDMSLALMDNFTNRKEITAGQDLNFNSTGNLLNYGQLNSGQLTSITADRIDNALGGRITSDQHTVVSAQTDIQNRGLINSNDLTLVKAKGQLDNIGTGRIYGDHVAFAVNSLKNREENGKSAVIAARAQMDIGAQHIVNQEDAYIYSAGSLNIGGELNDKNQATGMAKTLVNASAKIEVEGDGRIAVNNLQNLNNHLEVEEYLAEKKWVHEYGLAGTDERWLDGKDVHFRKTRTNASLIFNDGRPEIFRSRYNVRDLKWWKYDQETYKERITESKPAQIIIGGNLNASGNQWLNKDSHIMIGGALINEAGFKGVDNKETFANQRIEKSGIEGSYNYKRRTKVSKKRVRECCESDYNPESVLTKYHFEEPISIFETNYTPPLIGEQPNIVQSEGKQHLVAEGAQSSPNQDISSGVSNTPIEFNVVLKEGVQQAIKIKTLPEHNHRLPNNSLYSINPNSPHYLIETDPEFTNQHRWLGSDYMLNALSIDPSRTHKRLGDGFYEQRLINEEIQRLTGFKRLDAYQNGEEQFKALMDAGVTFAKQFNLVPGIALSAEQIQRLTSDMVWLQTEQVTLADGSIQTVLVPKVYVMVRKGDVDSSGALISADIIQLNDMDKLVNTGKVAGRNLVNLEGKTIENTGDISAKTVWLDAAGKLDNIGGRIKAQDLLVAKGNEVLLASSTSTGGDKHNGHTIIDRVAGLYLDNDTGTEGQIRIEAQKDVLAKAAVIANQTGGTTYITSRTGNVDLGTLTTEHHESTGALGDKNHRHVHATEDIGSQINTKGDIFVTAEQGKVLVRGSDMGSVEGEVWLKGQQGVEITEGRKTLDIDEAWETNSKGFLSKTKHNTHYQRKHDESVASNVTGNKVGIVSLGGNVLVQGSNVIADEGLFIKGKKVDIVASQDSYQDREEKIKTKSGLMGTGGIGFMIGTRKDTTDNKDTNTTYSASMVGSLDDSVNIIADEAYTQKGSIVSAAKNGKVNVVAKKIDVKAINEVYNNDYKHVFEQKGLTVAISNPVLDAVQATVNSAQKVGKSNNARVNAMAAANLAYDTYKAGSMAQDLMSSNTGGGEGQGSAATSVNVSITYGQQKNTDTSKTTREQALKSKIRGGEVNLVATGAGEDSNINIVGSDVAGINATRLQADNEVNIVSKEQGYSNRSDNKSVGGNVGVALSFGNGFSFGVTAGANYGKGHANADEVAHAHSHVGSDTGRTTIISGGATNIKGGQVIGKGIGIDAKELNVESVQDTAKFKQKQINLQGQVTVGYGFSGSGSGSFSKVKADFASTREQSGIYAGDDGYQINVKNNTDLKGGLITSTQAAEDMGKNSFSTGSLTHSDVDNYSHYKGKGFGVGGGLSMGGGKGPKEVGGVKLTAQGSNNQDGSSAVGFSKSIGIGSDSGNDKSVTLSGVNTRNITITDKAAQFAKTGQTAQEVISAVYTDTTTDNAIARSGVIDNNFDKDKVLSEVNLQVDVSKQFDGNRQEIKAKINTALDENKHAYEEGRISESEYEEKQRTLKNTGLLFDSIAAGLGTPSTNAAGSVLAAASPVMAQQIGEYFKSGKGGGEGSPQHILAHTILGTAVSAATGNNAFVGGLSAGGAEAVAPAVAKWLYGKEAKDLSADEKATVSSIVGLGGMALGATTGNVNDIATGSSLAQNAVDNNALIPKKARANLSSEEEKVFFDKLLNLVKTDAETIEQEYKSCPDKDCEKQVVDKAFKSSEQLKKRVIKLAEEGEFTDREIELLDNISKTIVDTYREGKIKGDYSRFYADVVDWSRFAEDDFVPTAIDAHYKTKHTQRDLAKGMSLEEIEANQNRQEWWIIAIGALGSNVKAGNIKKVVNKNLKKGSPLPQPNKVEVKTTSGEDLAYKSHTKHTAGQRGNRPDAEIEPKNSLELFKNSIPSTNPNSNARYAYDGKQVHQFFADSSGKEYHWSGTKNKSQINQVPIEVVRKLGVNTKKIK